MKSITVVKIESGSNWTLYQVLVSGEPTDYTIHGHRWAGGASWTVREGDSPLLYRPTLKAAVAALREHLADAEAA